MLAEVPPWPTIVSDNADTAATAPISPAVGVSLWVIASILVVPEIEVPMIPPIVAWTLRTQI